MYISQSIIFHKKEQANEIKLSKNNDLKKSGNIYIFYVFWI